MEVPQLFVIAFLCVFILIILFGVFIEPLYILIFKKPLYIHWYPFIKKLDPSQRGLLLQEVSFYKKLSSQRKQYFEHRVASFMAKYQFIGKNDFIVTDRCRVLIAATYVMLTFGMRHYLIDSFNKIIIYPRRYLSTITGEYHKGEFNPRLKIVVFSWKDFYEGLQVENDNLNLGLHEFSHALYFHGLNSRDQSSVVFSDTLNTIKKYLIEPDVLNQIVKSNYFRIYAYTNQVEFMAVILEHFFETPEIFKKEFPELFKRIAVMINFDDQV